MPSQFHRHRARHRHRAPPPRPPAPRPRAPPLRPVTARSASLYPPNTKPPASPTLNPPARTPLHPSTPPVILSEAQNLRISLSPCASGQADAQSSRPESPVFRSLLCASGPPDAVILSEAQNLRIRSLLCASGPPDARSSRPESPVPSAPQSKYVRAGRTAQSPASSRPRSRTHKKSLLPPRPHHRRLELIDVRPPHLVHLLHLDRIPVAHKVELPRILPARARLRTHRADTPMLAQPASAL